MPTNETKEQVVEAKRERIPIHASKSVLDAPGLDRTRFFYRYIRIQNPENVQRYIDAGYQFVNRSGGQYVGDKNVATTEGFGSLFTKTGKDGITLGLVALPLELWKLDQESKFAENQKLLDTQFRSLQAQMDPKTGGYGHIGEHPGQHSPGRPSNIRRV